MMSPRLVRCVVFFFWVASLTVVSAQTPKKAMGLVEFLNIPNLSEPRLSPDGRQVLYELHVSDWEANRQTGHIWRHQVESAESHQLTFGEQGERDPRWSPDGRQIAFLTRRGKEKVDQIYVMSTAGGEARSVTAHETAVSNPKWSQDGQSIYFLATDPKSAESKARDKAKDDVFAFDENYRHRHLWRVSLSDNSEEKITDGAYSVLNYQFSAQGDRVLLHRAPTPLIDDSDESEIWLLDLSGGNAFRLTENAIPESSAELSPDGSQVLFLAGASEAFEGYHNRNLFLIPSIGGTPRALFKDVAYEIRSARWADEDRIFLVVNAGLESQLAVVRVSTGQLEFLTRGEHSIRSWHHTGESHLISLDRATNPGDLWLLGAETPIRQLTTVFEYLEEQFELPRQQRISWPGVDGVRVEGLLIYPTGYVSGRRYPLVVQTHGGPASADRFGFGSGTSRYNPVLAGLGYAILRPNYRGSTGYGNAFLRDMVGHYFQNAHLDVMAGVDHVIEMGVADPDRLVKMGWSAGGHMTNKIITFTDRFKAASSGAGAVNWISMYGQSDVRIYRTPWFGGTPWQQEAPISTYWEHSPLKDIARVTTPTLVLVGENDVRVPPPQSVELYRALRSNGVPTRLYIAPREPHGWRELRHRLFKMNAELDWFSKYALEQEYVWEKAPARGGGSETEEISEGGG